MPKLSDGTYLIEDAHVVFLNFAGKKTEYNNQGNRNFCILLSEADAVELAEDGWNVKTLKPREDEGPRPYIQVTVAFGNRPPKVVMVTSKGRTTLTEDEVEVIDWIDIHAIDLIIRPYDWSVSGNTGRKAYLKSFFVTLEEDYLDMKYAHIQEINASASQLAIGSGSRLDYDFDGEVVDE